MDALSKRVIKGYEVQEFVGAGGFGAVYRAYQPSVGREVAIKVILPEYANRPDFVRRFEVEVQLIARLEHPHIVPLYDYWREPEGAFLVMRWLPANLRSSLQRGPWSGEAAAQLLEQLAAALTIAHREGVIHRDIKPDNILLDEDENAYLADFGIAKDLTAQSHTEDNALVGSPMYISPEQIKGESVTPRSDIYLLGLVIYEMLAGEKAYIECKTPAEYIYKHLNIPLPPLQVKRPTLPAAINEVLQTATAKDALQRYANVQRFAEAFRAALPNLQRAPAQPLAEPLTERELDILRLMVAGLNNQEIARQLVLSAGTVKWYVNQIYVKLDVHSRRQAIERAAQLGLNAEPTSITPRPKPNGRAREAANASPTFIATSQMINPYKGLRAFQEADAVDFFGRAGLTEQLLARLSESGGGGRFLVVAGPSGSGKSSVVRAGLVPALRRGALPNSKGWFITDMLPGTHPLEELEAALLRVATSPQSGLLSQLSEDRRGLVRAVKRILPADQDTELLLVIDQFEELFTLVVDEGLREHFIDNLLSAVTDPRSRVRIIATLRADFYDRPLVYPRLAELVRSHTELVLPLTDDELERAIAGPAERVGLMLEPGLVTTIVNDIGKQPGALPLLQFALTELFNRRKEHKLTLGAYRESGGLKGALGRRADELYDELDPQLQEVARQIFLRLVTLGEGTEDTRRRVTLAELAPGEGTDEVINAFSRYRLLTLDHDPLTRGSTLEIAHEALIREWAKLREWLRENREDLLVQRQLTQAAAEWQRANHERSFLANGMRLLRFETLAAGGKLALNADEYTYLDASIEQRVALDKAESERRAQEAKIARRAQNFGRAAAVLAGIGVLAIILTVIAFLTAQNAIKEREGAATDVAQAITQVAQAEATRAGILRDAEITDSLRLASVAQQLVNEDPQLALALALEATNLASPPPQAEQALAEVAFAPGIRRRLVGHNNWIENAIFSPDGRTALSTDENSMILWDLATGTPIHTVTGLISAIAFSPDGNTAIYGTWDGTITLWDVATGASIQMFSEQVGAVTALEFTPDGRSVVSGTWGGLILWDVATGEQLHTFTGYNSIVEGVAISLSPDSRTVLSGDWDRRAILWDLETGERLHTFVGHRSFVESVAVSPDGKTALTSELDPGRGTFQTGIILWDLATGERLRTFRGHIGRAYSVAFSPDGKTALSGSATLPGSSDPLQNSMVLWDVATGTPIRTFAHTQPITTVAFSPDGRSALSGSSDSTLILWSLGTDEQENRFVGQTDRVTSLTVTNDNMLIVAGSSDNTFALLDIATGEIRRTFSGHTDRVTSVVLSADGTLALSGAQDMTMRLGDVATGELLQTFIGHTDEVTAVALSADNQVAVSASADNTLIVWDVTTGNPLRNLDKHTSDVTSVALSADGKLVLSGSNDTTLILWDVVAGEVIRTFTGHLNRVRSLALSADAHLALSGADDGVILLWDVATGEVLRTFSGHTNHVSSVTFSTDGRRALSSAWDNTTILWDVETGVALRIFTGHSDRVMAAALSPDGRTAFSGDVDGTIISWHISTLDELIDWIYRNRDVPELTCAQRETYRVAPYCDGNGISPTRTPYSISTATTSRQ